MAELGIIASVIQVADVGIRLSVTLYTFGQAVASADDSIVFISKDISHTCSILKTLGHSLEKDHDAQLYSQDAINTAETIVKECLEIFHEMDEALLKKIKRIGLDGSSNRAAVVALERLKWPFLRPKVMLLWSNLEKLKSSLLLMLNVFIYARSLVKRTEDPSLVNDQRIMIEHLLRTTAEQSGKYDSLKAAMDCNKTLDIVRDRSGGSLPATPGPGLAMLPIEVPNKGKTKRLLEAPEVDPATARLEGYCTLIEHLMTEVETEDYNIGDDMRCRIRDDVVHTHKRETRLLRAIHGYTKLDEKMREKSWRLADMVEEKVEEGEQLQVGQRVESSSGVQFDLCEDQGPQNLDPNSSHSSPVGETQEHVRDFVWPPPENVPMTTTTDRVRASKTIPAIERFLNNREDPWSPVHLISEAPMVLWRAGTSMLALHKILPLNPLTPYINNEHMSQLPFLRSETSMLVTEKSHVVETIPSSQDLAALTDSTDTDTTDTETYVSARSVIGESPSDSQHLCLVDGEDNGPLAVLGDQGYIDPAGKDGGRLGVANPSSDELLAALVIST